jgi:mycothiol synthase
MTAASEITRVEPHEFDWSRAEGVAADVRRVVSAATTEDRSAPLDEAAVLALRNHGLAGSQLWTAGSDGFAWLHDGAVDLVVSPSARGQGVGGALAAAAVSGEESLTAWSHGNHPAAARLAARFDFDRVRDLWVMRRPLTGLPRLSEGPDGIEVRPFRVGTDEAAFLAVNAEAFAHHPEQGAMTRADLDERMAEPWFDPAGFFVAERSGELLGFHWTKVHDERPPFGEVYVVGVSPQAQGGGLGKRLTLTGLHHLARLGLEEVVLYVEADNHPAIAIYTRLGFSHAVEDTHVQYARRWTDGRPNRGPRP